MIFPNTDTFYPEQTVTRTSSDPDFVTPAIKCILRRKNRLMRKGRVEEAGALANRVRIAIIHQNTSQLHKVNIRRNAKEAWSMVRKFTKPRRNADDRDVNETLGPETETFDFQSETRPRPRPSHTLPRPRRDRDLQVLGPRRDRDRDVERPRPRHFSRRWHFGLPK